MACDSMPGQDSIERFHGVTVEGGRTGWSQFPQELFGDLFAVVAYDKRAEFFDLHVACRHMNLHGLAAKEVDHAVAADFRDKLRSAANLVENVSSRNRAASSDSNRNAPECATLTCSSTGY